MRLSRYVGSRWSLFAGIVMMVLGGFIWFNPFDTLLALAFYIGFGFILAGSFYLIAAYNLRMGWYLLVGAFDVLVGIVLISNLGITAISLPIILALWCLTVGVIQIISSMELMNIELPWKFTALMGYLGFFLGVVMLVFPNIGAIVISTIIGFYAIMFGIFQIMEYHMCKNMYQPC